MLADINFSYDSVLLALIAAIISPIVLQIVAERRRKVERAEAKADREEAKKEAAEAREAAEAVAIQAAEAARLLAERQDAEEARQIKVAAQAAEAARLLLESNERVQARSEALAEQITVNTEQTMANAAKLETIATNTDGALTKSMKGTLAALDTGLGALRALASERIEAAKRFPGVDVTDGQATEETLRAIKAGEAEAAALRAEINMRFTTMGNLATGEIPVTKKK